MVFILKTYIAYKKGNILTLRNRWILFFLNINFFLNDQIRRRFKDGSRHHGRIQGGGGTGGRLPFLNQDNFLKYQL